MAPKKGEEPEIKPLFGRVGTNLKVGIVGVPNVGKSTFFNVLTKSEAAAENFPFCTIEPNENKYTFIYFQQAFLVVIYGFIVIHLNFYVLFNISVILVWYFYDMNINYFYVFYCWCFGIKLLVLFEIFLWFL